MTLQNAESTAGMQRAAIPHPAPRMGVLASLQTGRGLAAVLVLLTHSTYTVSRPNYYGQVWFDQAFAFTGLLAVCFFFVLSGFIILYAHEGDIGKPPRLRRYLTRRVERVYPIYWITFLGVSAAAYVLPPMHSLLPASLGPWFAALTLVPMDPAVVGGSGAPVIVVAWTLQYEIAFYALFALAIINRYLLLLAIAMIFLARLACANGCSFPLHFVSRDYMLLFPIGMMVSWVATRRLSGSVRARGGLVMVGVGFLMAFLASPLPERLGMRALPGSRELLFGAASALVIYGCVWAERGGVTLGKSRFLQLLGAASYSIYLVHFPTLSVAGKVVRKLQGGALDTTAAWICVVAMMCVSIGVGIAVHLLIEAPLARRLAAFRRKGETTPVVPVPIA